MITRIGGRRADAQREADQPLRDDQFWSAVRALPRAEAQVVALHYVEELTVVEIAQVHHCDLPEQAAPGRSMSGAVVAIRPSG